MSKTEAYLFYIIVPFLIYAGGISSLIWILIKNFTVATNFELTVMFLAIFIILGLAILYFYIIIKDKQIIK